MKDVPSSQKLFEKVAKYSGIQWWEERAEQLWHQQYNNKGPPSVNSTSRRWGYIIGLPFRQQSFFLRYTWTDGKGKIVARASNREYEIVLK